MMCYLPDWYQEIGFTYFWGLFSKYNLQNNILLVQFLWKSRWWLTVFLRKIWQNTWTNMDPTCDILVEWTISNHKGVGTCWAFYPFVCVFFHSSSLTEMEKWMEDIKVATETANTSNGPSSDLLTSNLTNNRKLQHCQTVEMYISVCKSGKINSIYTVTISKY